MPLYRQILKQALALTLKYRFLWMLGLLAALVNNASIFQLLTINLPQASGGDGNPFFKFGASSLFQFSSLANLGWIALTDTFSLFLVLLYFLFFFIVIFFWWWLGVRGEIALIFGIQRIHLKKHTDLKSAWFKTPQYFTSALLINLGAKILIYLMISLLILILAYLINQNRNPSLVIFFFMVFILFLTGILMISFLIKYALGYLILKNNSFVSSLRKAWSLFIHNWVISIEMALILFLIDLVIGLLSLVILLFLSLPFVLLGIIFYYGGLTAGFWLVLVPMIFVFFIFMAGLTALVSTFQYASWMLLFMKLVEEGGVSKIERVYQGMKAKLSAKFKMTM